MKNIKEGLFKRLTQAFLNKIKPLSNFTWFTFCKENEETFGTT